MNNIFIEFITNNNNINSYENVLYLFNTQNNINNNENKFVEISFYNRSNEMYYNINNLQEIYQIFYNLSNEEILDFNHGYICTSNNNHIDYKCKIIGFRFITNYDNHNTLNLYIVNSDI